MSDINAIVSDVVGINDSIQVPYNTHTIYDDSKIYDGIAYLLQQYVYNNSFQYDDHKEYNGKRINYINRLVNFNRSNTDSLSLTDSLTNVLKMYAFISDSVGITDLLTKESSIRRSNAENIGLADVLLKSSSLQRLFADSLGVSDINRAGFFFSRNISDSVGIEDFLTRVASYGRKVLDTTGVSEQATRSFIASRKIADSSNINEYVSFLTYKAVTDWGEAPKIEAIVIQPLVYSEPERMVVYSLNNQPLEGEVIGSSLGVVFSGKLYDSHDLYNSHIPYYSGISTDKSPTIEGIYNI
jgi:hypothetical protein